MLGAPPCATSRFFYAAGCFSLCCTGLALILLGFGARSKPYPDPWEDPKVDSTTPVVRTIETLCGASSYAARFLGHVVTHTQIPGKIRK